MHCLLDLNVLLCASWDTQCPVTSSVCAMIRANTRQMPRLHKGCLGGPSDARLGHIWTHSAGTRARPP